MFDWVKKIKKGRRSNEVTRETKPYPSLTVIGQGQNQRRFLYKPTPLNLRYFSKTVYARRAINAIKNPICQLDWEVTPVKGISLNSELKRQIEVASFCLEHPNNDDSSRTLFEAVIEDILCGAGAYEQHLGGDAARPLWIWPVDGLSIQINPSWSGDINEPRYLQQTGFGTLGNARNGIQLKNDELVYIRPSPNTSSPFGIGPLEVAFLSIARKIGIEKYAGNVSTNADPSGILYLGEEADTNAVRTFRSYWKNDVEGQGQTPIIGGGKDPKYINLRTDGDKAVFLAYQELLIREIAASFDLSPMNFGIEHDVNRDTSEACVDRDWDHAIRPHADNLASYITRETIQGKLGFSQLQFKFCGLNREDEKATADIMKTYYDINVLTPNDILERLGKPKSVNEFADKCKTECDISTAAARGVKGIDDPALGSLNVDPTPNPPPSNKSDPAVKPAKSETKQTKNNPK